MYSPYRQNLGTTEEDRCIIELYTDICPKTCANFLSLCDGKYAGTPVHRVMPTAFVQCGDIASGSGDGGEAADGGTFADESFAVNHSGAGIVAMANAGGMFGRECAKLCYFARLILHS